MATGRLPDPNTAPVTAKGDLYTYSTVPAKLAVGNNGETLVADSSTSTGLRWQGNFAAGKNALINADFRINQRAFTSTTTNGAYGFDRWAMIASDGTTTYSAQTFTAGTAPVAGYEAINFARMVSSGQTLASAFSIIQQKIEDVRTFAGQTVTVSFWAKAASGTPSVAIELQQHFGTGGSPSASVNTALGKVAITTSWARYSATVAVPSISGKTLGTANDSRLTLDLFTSAGTDFNTRASNLGIQSATIDFWGVQVEAGSVATAFQTATGTLAGELQAAQRYYFRISASTAYDVIGYGSGWSTTRADIGINLPVRMRVTPTALDFSGLLLQSYGTATTYAVTGAAQNSSQPTLANVTLEVASGSSAGSVQRALLTNSSTAFIGFSAEL